MSPSRSGRRGPRKQYSVPNKSFSLFTVTAGDSSGAVDSCPRNTSGQRVSTAGLGEGPLEGGPRDADGFLMKVEDDDLKIVIYQQMSMGEREFAIAFMAQDTPAPPGKPNACLSKYERAIIATYNDITTADFNGDTHWRELIERANAKGPAPQRLPKNPLVLKGVGTGKGKAEPAPKSEPQGLLGNMVIQRLAAMEGGTVQNASAVARSENAEVSSLPPSVLKPGELKTFLDKPFDTKIRTNRPNILQSWCTIEEAVRAAAQEIRGLAKQHYPDYEEMRAANLMLPEAGVRIVEVRSGGYTYIDIIVGNAFGGSKIATSSDDEGLTKVWSGRIVSFAAALHFHWVDLESGDVDDAAAEWIGHRRLNLEPPKYYEEWVASYDSERRYYRNGEGFQRKDVDCEQ